MFLHLYYQTNIKTPVSSPQTLPFICKRESVHGQETHLKWFRKSAAEGLNRNESVEEMGEKARIRA